jgi:hypothetical protein
MMLDDLWDLFQEQVFPVSSDERLFNPYGGRNESCDRRTAAHIRRENLRNYLACFKAPPPVLLIGEAPGPWDCRFSGVPITGERHLLDPEFPLHGRQSSTAERPHASNSSVLFWSVMLDSFPRFLIWNSVPLHPHKEGEPLSVRGPKQSEVRRFRPVVDRVVSIVEPRVVVAMGRKAEGTLEAIGVACTYVRHPSHGGAKPFEQGMRRVFEDV